MRVQANSTWIIRTNYFPVFTFFVHKTKLIKPLTGADSNLFSGSVTYFLISIQHVNQWSCIETQNPLKKIFSVPPLDGDFIHITLPLLTEYFPNKKLNEMKNHPKQTNRKLTFSCLAAPLPLLLLSISTLTLTFRLKGFSHRSEQRRNGIHDINNQTFA